MTPEQLRELCSLTVELTRLRQNQCKHLCIESFAPDLLRDLIIVTTALEEAKPTSPAHEANER